MSILAVVAGPEPFVLRSSPATTTAPSHFLCFHLTAAGVSTSPHIFATYPPPLTLRFGSISSKKWIPFVAREKYVIKEDEEDDGGFWEDPDVGYDDDEIEDDEAREGKRSAISVAASRDSSFSSSSSKSSLALDISDEVELLLSDEERAIWQQNETPDLSKISTKKWNPLHTLALSQQIPVMDKLLEYGMHIDTVDKDGFAALHKAVIGKKEAVISHLLRKGADPHCRDRDGATPLHYAVQVGALQTVKLLIKYKVDVNVADNDGWTPLHIAIQSRSRDIAKVLLVNGADKTRRNKDGKTPLDISLCYGRDFKSYELAKLLKLVPYGVDP